MKLPPPTIRNATIINATAALIGLVLLALQVPGNVPTWIRAVAAVAIFVSLAVPAAFFLTLWIRQARREADRVYLDLDDATRRILTMFNVDRADYTEFCASAIKMTARILDAEFPNGGGDIYLSRAGVAAARQFTGDNDMSVLWFLGEKLEGRIQSSGCTTGEELRFTVDGVDYRAATDQWIVLHLRGTQIVSIDILDPDKFQGRFHTPTPIRTTA